MNTRFCAHCVQCFERKKYGYDMLLGFHMEKWLIVSYCS